MGGALSERVKHPTERSASDRAGHCLRHAAQGRLQDGFELSDRRYMKQKQTNIWVWVKIKPPGDCGFYSLVLFTLVLFTRVPLWVLVFDPQPYDFLCATWAKS